MIRNIHLHFAQSTEPLEGGGVGRAAMELSEGLEKAGLSSRVVTTGRRASSTDQVIAFERKGPTRFFYAPEMRVQAPALVAESTFIHGHGFYVGPNWMLGRQARLQRKKLIYHPHGMLEPWIVARSGWKKRIVHSLFEDANFQYAHLWRALTGKEVDQIRAQGISAPVVVCPNGVDLEKYQDLGWLRPAGASHKVLLFLARLHPKKGLDLLLRAWASLPRAIYQDWKLVIAGPNELGHRGEIEALILECNLSAHVSFIGEVSGESKLKALASADAFVLPSRSEGFSVAILEAMASRLPVLATTACNFAELATIGGGWCVEPTAEALRVGLHELFAASSDELRSRGKASYNLVKTSYAWSSIVPVLNTACLAL